ncbi:bifunctional metallophosphatase/5'-nucleotidase [Vibrio sp. WXL103]|uniref:bifunctional metallophosphatase/5'-nucleotidase n=1 Tax=Vibrio sp. WXL103 TaxID=3450710 RepID=UPI003EC6F12E
MKKTLLVSLLAATSGAALAKDVTILYTNDIHAHSEPFIARYVDGERPVGGFANIAAWSAQEKAANPASIFVDAGDYFSGPYLCSLTKGEAIIDIMNTMNYDVASIGNHEFDYGWDNMLVQLAKADFELLLGNVFFENSDKPVWDKPYTIIEKDGIRFGVIGLHGKFAFYDTVSAAQRQNLEARDEIEYLQTYLDELRSQVDITIALMHQGTPARQSSEGTTDVRRALDKDIETAKQVTGLDILVTGHAHVGTPEPIEVNDTLIVSTDGYGINAGKLVLDFDEENRTIRGYEFELKTLWADEWTPQPETQEVIDKWKQNVEVIAKQKVIDTDEVLTRAYGQSSPMGNISADATLFAFENADIGFMNSGALRNDIEAGTVTLGDILSVFPFPNTAMAMDLTGNQLKDLMEHSAGLTNGVLQVSAGFEMHYDSSRTVGSRVVSMTLHGEAIKPEQSYRVVANNFIADGGDGFLTFVEGANIEERTDMMMTDLMAAYMRANRELPGKDEMRVLDLAE